jgi:hypothetical protein
MRTLITFDELRDEIQAMHLALPRFGLTADTMAGLVRVYRDTLGVFDLEAVHGGAGLIRREATKFPSPASWHDAIRTWLKHNRIQPEYAGEVDADGNDIVCRTCRSVARWAILKMNVTPFSSPMKEPREGMELGYTRRRIAVCNSERHHTSHGVTSLPENFVAWEA